MNFLRRLRVRTRLAGSFAALAVLLVAVVVTGVAGYGTQEREAAAVARALDQTHEVMQAKFRTADFAGWQTGYAFDINRGLPGADQETQGQRAAFLASTAAFRTNLDNIRSYSLTEAESALLADAASEFDAFMAVDQQIIGRYRQHTAAATRQANDLASGESLTHFGKLADDVSKLADSVAARGQAAATAASRSATSGRRIMWLAGIFGLALAVVLAALVTASVTGPLRSLAGRLREIAGGGGDLTTRLPETGADELTEVSHAFNQFQGSLQTLIRDVAASASALSGAANELVSVGDRLGQRATQTANQADLVSTAAEEVGGDLRTVAAGAEEMSASIREIAQNAGEAARVAADAVASAQATHETIGKLDRSSNEIGSVLKVITSIAEQTNLLALNATIEAARAGEAGKGFAVVANEVKELAQETASATENIRQRIGTIQEDTGAAVTAIDAITGIIGQISDYTTGIASAVEEQTATTNEMSRTISTASASSERITATIGAVAEAAADTTEAAASSQTAADSLSRLSDQLAGLVGRFRT